MTDRVALRAGVPPFYVMDVWLAAAERQRTHGDLVNLSAGQPSAGAPEPVRAAAAAALHLNQLGYSVALVFRSCATLSPRITNAGMASPSNPMRW